MFRSTVSRSSGSLTIAAREPARHLCRVPSIASIKKARPLCSVTNALILRPPHRHLGGYGGDDGLP